MSFSAPKSPKLFSKFKQDKLSGYSTAKEVLDNLPIRQMGIHDKILIELLLKERESLAGN